MIDMSKLKLVLADDTKIVPLANVPPDLVDKLGSNVGDFGIFRSSGRSKAKVINSELYAFLSQFSKAQGISQAVVQHARATNAPAEELLEELFPIIKQLVDESYLVEHDDSAKSKPLVKGRKSFSSFNIQRPVQLLDDVDVYCANDNASRLVALKIARENDAHARDGLTHEAEVLRKLAGLNVPSLYEAGVVENSAFISMEWIQGIAIDKAADALRQQSRIYPWVSLLDLVVNLVNSYSEIHEAGIFHGDVHPKNIMVRNDDKLTVIDFGLAALVEGTGNGHRGGIGFYFEPEYAKARLQNEKPPKVTSFSEQYSLAVVVFQVLTGQMYLPFSMEREEAYRQIAGHAPRTFASLSLEAFPQLEKVLEKALSKHPSDRYSNLKVFATELQTVKQGLESRIPDDSLEDLKSFLAKQIAIMQDRGNGFDVKQAPRASVNLGLAGYAYGVNRIAINLRRADLAELADQIAERASNERDSEGAFWNEESGMTEDLLTRQSVLNAQPGLDAVRAIIANSRGDSTSFLTSLRDFMSNTNAVQNKKLDFAFGTSGSLVIGSNLLGLLKQHSYLESSFLHDFLATLYEDVDSKLKDMTQGWRPDFKSSGVLGAAHGWGGYFYSVLRWLDASDSKPTPELIVALKAFGTQSVPIGRGLNWARNTKSTKPEYLGSWCNGASGLVSLWLLAHRLTGDDQFFAYAVGASWASWESRDSGSDLCCGSSGRAYALLSMYRASGDVAWYERAISLVRRSIANAEQREDSPVGLYKGLIGTLVVVSDILADNSCSMPFFGEEI
jgi:serine/threonine protein kinase